VIRIVEAGPGDREEVVSLVERLLRELEERPDEFAGLDREKTLRDLAAAGSRFTAFLARTPEGEAVGVATLVETFAIYANGSYGVIDEMYVAPDHRARGVGRQLIEAIKRHGWRKGWLRIDVTAPAEERWRRTVKFYESQGFTFTGPKLRFRLDGAELPAELS